jgi:hypothetical protein
MDVKRAKNSNGVYQNHKKNIEITNQNGIFLMITMFGTLKV